MNPTEKLYLWVLGLTCVLSAVARTCPYDAKECTCVWNSMLCKGLASIPSLKTGNDVYPITELIFDGGSITSVPNNSLPPNLQYLEFRSVPITDIADNAFQESPTLRGLTISSSALQHLPRSLLDINNLKIFDLSGKHIDVWDTDILDHLAKSVITLYLSDVGLTAWPSWLSTFKLLVVVDLSLNPLKTIPDDAFDALKGTLSTIKLAGTGLTQVPKALSVLTQLTELVLSNNPILDINGIEQLNSFPCANTLYFLNVSSIGLTVYPNLSGFTRLITLTLDNNRITNANAGSTPESLTSLFIENNLLTSVPPFISSLPSLSTLRLAYNRITEVSFDMFPPSLKKLDLSNNQITKITDATSKLTSRLQSVYLSFNPISTISNSAFKNLGSLFIFHLDSTSLTRIPLALTSLKTLTSMHLWNNRFLTCPCPPEPELVQWFEPYIGHISYFGYCSNNVDLEDYLRHPC